MINYKLREGDRVMITTRPKSLSKYKQEPNYIIVVQVRGHLKQNQDIIAKNMNYINSNSYISYYNLSEVEYLRKINYGKIYVY